MTTRRARRTSCLRAGSAALVLVAAAACGTTVPLSQRGGSIAPAAAVGGTGAAAQANAAAGDDGSIIDPGVPSGAPAAATSAAATALAQALGQSPNVATLVSPAPGDSGAPVPQGDPSAATGPGAVADPPPGAGPTSPGSAPTSAGAAPSAGPTRAGSKPTKAGSKPSAAAPKGSAPGSTAPAAGGASSAPAGGGGGATTASVTTPVKIGFLYFDASSAAAVNSAAGVTTNATLTAKGTVESLVASFNKNGGLDGRQIQLVEQVESSNSTNYASDAAAACQYFTQDNPVPIVLDTSYGGGNGFDSCLSNAGVEDLTIGTPNDAASLKAIPYEIALQRMTADRAYPAALTQLAKAGYLSSGNKLGVFLDNCAPTTASYNNAILPTIKRLNLTVAKTFTSTCINGESGLGQAGSDTSSAVLQFRSAGVDRVMVVSTEDPTYYILFGEAANSQGYTPGYVLTSNAEPNQLEMNFSAAQKANLHGAGQVPVLDIDNAKLPGSPGEASCVAMAEAGGTTPATQSDYYYISSICGPFLLVQAAFKLDGAVATASTLSKAIAQLGTSFSDPGVLNGSADLSHQDAPADASLFAYDTGCSCINYTGSPSPA